MASPKYEGEKQTCKCGTQLTAVTIVSEWQGNKTEKLQWQNPDGKAHYKFAGAGKFDCNIPEGQEIVASADDTGQLTITPPINITGEGIQYEPCNLVDANEILQTILREVLDIKKEIADMKTHVVKLGKQIDFNPANNTLTGDTRFPPEGLPLGED